MPHETTQPHYQHHVGSSSQVESFQQHNEVEGTDDDIPLHPLLPFHLNNNDHEENHHVAQVHINDNFFYISIL